MQQDTLKIRQDTLKVKQDTLKIKAGVGHDTVTVRRDSLIITDSLRTDEVKKITRPARHFQEVLVTDTTSVCTKSSIYNFTFSDTTGFFSQPGFNPASSFPFRYAENIQKRRESERTSLIANLHAGEKLPVHLFHQDWILLVIMGVAFLYSIVRSSSKGLLSSLLRFFLLRGINDPSSRDLTGLFTWQSSVLNLVSFTTLGLFFYLSATFYNIYIPVSHNLVEWLFCTGIIIAGVTFRHFICMLTGNLSGQREVFREYLDNVYQSYRVGALIIFFIIILISYTDFLPPVVFFVTGLTVLGLMYFLRVTRLLIIFLNRNISIFYLILYLCALEILPVLVLIKYFTGLI